MTKGKYANRSDIRRAEAAHHHIDRLIGELTEAKVRARENQAAADMLPGVQAELTRVRQLAEAGSSDTLEKERARFNAVVEATDVKMGEVIDLLLSFLKRAEEVAGPDVSLIDLDEVYRIRAVIGPIDIVWPEFGSNRRKRRACAASVERVRAMMKAFDVDNKRGSLGDLMARHIACSTASDDDPRGVKVGSGFLPRDPDGPYAVPLNKLPRQDGDEATS